MNDETKRRLGALALGFALTASPGGTADPAPAPCGRAENRQFDFWVGEWDVQDPKGNRRGRTPSRASWEDV